MNKNTHSTTGIGMFAQMLNDLAEKLTEADGKDDRVGASIALLIESELFTREEATELANLV